MNHQIKSVNMTPLNLSSHNQSTAKVFLTNVCCQNLQATEGETLLTTIGVEPNEQTMQNVQTLVNDVLTSISGIFPNRRLYQVTMASRSTGIRYVCIFTTDQKMLPAQYLTKMKCAEWRDLFVTSTNQGINYKVNNLVHATV